MEHNFKQPQNAKQIALAKITAIKNHAKKHLAAFTKHLLQNIPKTPRHEISEDEYYYNLGIDCANTGNYEAAIKAYSTAIDKNPNPPDYYYISRGSSFGMLGEAEKAIDDFNRAIERNKNSEDAYLLKGDIHFELGKSAHYKQGLFDNFKQKELDEALYCYNKVIEINPDSAKAHYYRGAVLFMFGEGEKARTEYLHAIALNPDYANGGYYDKTCPQIL